MHKIIRDRTIVEDDWQLIRSADAVTVEVSSARLIVPLVCWVQHRVRACAGRVAVWLDSHEDPDAIAGDLPTLPLVAINFPKFTDGRGYSIARLLRERHGYQGELRAIGDVLRDQLFYMSRCGFNAFAVRSDKSVEDAVHAFDDFTEAYQVSVERPVPLFRRRSFAGAV